MGRRVFFGWTKFTLEEGVASDSATLSDALTQDVIKAKTASDGATVTDSSSSHNAGQNVSVGYWGVSPFQRLGSRMTLGVRCWYESTGRKESIETEATASDTVKASDTAASELTNCTEGIEITDSASMAGSTYSLSVGDGIEVRDAGTPIGNANFAHVFNYIRGMIVWREFAFLKREPYTYTESLFDQTNVSDANSEVDVISGTGSDTINASDSTNFELVIPASASDGIEVSDIPSTPWTLIGVFADGVVVEDEVEYVQSGGALSGYAEDVAEVIDSATALRVLARALSEITNLSDTASRIKLITTLAYDGIKLTDAALEYLTESYTSSDGVKASDTATADVTGRLHWEVSDGASMSDTAGTVRWYDGNVAVVVTSKRPSIVFS